MKKPLRLFLIPILLLSLVLGLSLPAVASIANISKKAETKAVTTKSTYSLMSGVSESALTVDGGHKAYMLQIAPSAKAELKASFSKYFTDNSTKASRSKAASSLGFSTMTTTAQAAAYETATGRDVIFTMNGNFFDSDTMTTRGYLVVEGNEIHEPDSDCVCYFAVLKDGSYDIRAYTEPHDDVMEAVAGRQWLVKDGVQMSQNKTQLSARTAIGLKADGTVVCFVVDGKTNSTGVTINDMCGIMYELGCVEAINLDGGGSSTFVTQRSSGGLTIRNAPSDSAGERPVVSTLMLVADPDSDHLYFDFTNNVSATERYQADIYGGLNYDTGSWHYHHTYNTEPVFDASPGTMSFTTTADCPTTRDIHPVITSNNTSYTSGHPLSYVPTGNDYFKIRMKISGATDTDANFRLLYASDDGTSSSNKAFACAIPAGAINNGYFVLEGYANFGGVDTVTAIRPEVYNLLISNPKTNPVTFTFDYIYIGSKEGAESGGSLYFDFNNSAEAQKRYDSISYGFLNFDNDTSPYWATTYNGGYTAFALDTSNGLLHVPVTDGFSGTVADNNVTYGPWLKTTNSYGNFTGRNTHSYFPLSYEPSEAEMVQIRFRITNCTVPSGTAPRLVLEYYYIDQDAHGFANDIRQTFAISSEYQTLTIEVPSTFRSVDVVKCFGLRFQNIMSSTTGTILIDYIYIGPACGGPAPQHQWNSGAVTEKATCTAAGTKTYTCENCGGTKTETVAPTGHTVASTSPVAPTCTATGLAEGKHCSVCKEVLTAQEVVPATGHTPVYTVKDAETHIVSCANCENTSQEAHTYVDGLCICGQVEIKEPIQNTAWKMGHTLNLASDISVNLALSKSLLAGYDMGTVYVLAELDTYEGNTKTGTKTIRILPVEKGEYYYFTLTGLTAVHMNDRIRSVLYGTKDGQPYDSPTDDYSIADYAYSQMNKANMPLSLKILCADLLRYGAKAQIFKSYRTDNLADHAMTDAHKAFLSDMDTVPFGNTNTVLSDLDSASITWAGKALDLNSKVTLKFIISPTGYTGKMEDLTLRLTYTAVSGETKTVIAGGAELYNAERNYYAFSFDGLLAAELRTVVSAQVYEGATAVSCTLRYSGDTYGNNKTGALGELCKALFAYSDSAKAYFLN